MKRNIALLLLLITVSFAKAQNEKPFKGFFINEEYQVYLNINLHDMDINVPDHELYGQLPGYLGKKAYSFFWVITDCTIKSKTKAEIELINDYGSEDLKATLKMPDENTLILTQGAGSTIKVPDNRKWKKLPKELVFKRQ